MESIQLSALTELDAVNRIIGTIGESPIDTLDDMTDVDAINAYRILLDISRQEQSRGWSFNRISHFKLTPDMYTKKIPWNSNILFLKANHHVHKLVRQGNYVKDLRRDSVIFEHPIDVEVVFYIPFDELPEQMRNYIISKACFIFQQNYFGDESLVKTTQMQMQEAWQLLQEFEIDNNNYSMFDHTYVRKLLMR